MTAAAIDNDIIIKGACYGLLPHFVAAVPVQLNDVFILGVAKYVIISRLRKARITRGAESAVRSFEDFIQYVQELEPDHDEEALAAEFEFHAQKNNLPFDAGESLLCAIVIKRSMSWFVTGDKRAIKAMQPVLTTMGKLDALMGKVLCLELLVLRLIRNKNANEIRDSICAESDIDKALTACMSCTNERIGPDSWIEGLLSYINEVKRYAPDLLAE